MSDKASSAQRGAAARRDAETFHPSPPAQGVSDVAQASAALSMGGMTPKSSSTSTPASTPRRTPLRKGGLLVALMLLAGALYWGFSSHFAGLKAGKLTSQQGAATAETADSAQQAASSADPEAVPPPNTLESALGLALQGVNLFSGEKGAELWRLKASWAHLSRENNEILVDLPVVRYTMGDPVANAGTEPVASTPSSPPASLPSSTEAQKTPQNTTQNAAESTVQPDYLDVKSEKGKITDSQRYLTLWGNVDVRRFGDILTGPRLEYDSKTRIMVFPEGATLESAKAAGEAARLTWNLGSNELMAEGGVVVVLKAQPAADPLVPLTPESLAPPTPAPSQAAPSAASTVSKPTRAPGKSGR